jgi:hypothetical protein
MFHDGFVRGRKWFRPPHWNAVRGELIQTGLGARRAVVRQAMRDALAAEGWRDGRRAGILPSPGTCHPPCLLFSWAVAGAIPSLSTSRSGARPRCLNHCEAAFSAKEPAHRRMRGGQVRSALQEGNLGEERVLNPRYPSPFRIRDAGEGRYPRSISPIRASYSIARSRRRFP